MFRTIFISITIITCGNIASQSRASEALMDTSQNPTEATLLMKCWDQTFAYNTFAIEETTNHYYVSLKGSTLNGSFDDARPFSLYNYSGRYEFGDWSSERHNYTVAYGKDKCTWNEVEQNIECDDGSETIGGERQTMYIEQDVDHLGQRQTVISMYSTTRLKLEASDQGLSLQKILTYNGETTIEELRVSRFDVGDQVLELSCSLADTSNSFLDVAAPTELIEFLEGAH